MKKTVKLILLIIIFLLMVLFRGLLLSLSPLIAVVLWFAVSLILVMEDRKQNRKVST